MANLSSLARQPEPELMDLPAEAKAYAAADFNAVNQAFVDRFLTLASAAGPPDRAGLANRASLPDRAGLAGDGRFTLIDLGCGPADIPLRIWAARPMWKITAVDGAAAMLEIANVAIRQAAANDAITTLLADAKATGLAAKFDAVISNSLLHHVADPLALWREMARLCRPGGPSRSGRPSRPGGLIFLRDLCRPGNSDQARKIVETSAGNESDILKEEFFRSLLAAYTLDEVGRQLRDAGLGHLNVAMASDRHLDVWGRM